MVLSIGHNAAIGNDESFPSLVLNNPNMNPNRRSADGKVVEALHYRFVLGNENMPAGME